MQCLEINILGHENVVVSRVLGTELHPSGCCLPEELCPGLPQLETVVSSSLLQNKEASHNTRKGKSWLRFHVHSHQLSDSNQQSEQLQQQLDGHTAHCRSDFLSQFDLPE